ncbi:hypothetical protein [Rhodobacter sp. 24-YEA-8]|uniref:hypothetical protein n=1 Tax=Rhodobacter sp. 24-YEA-8 TaxID=1884310 RepID=UPI0008965E82|nr:hypothetical protein [Rhodobacter sp. 24-YEA-8]SEB57768.1 hypothetical protein SAMN05519105_0814 [Rhodobacter sp. 24-YEA-8]
MSDTNSFIDEVTDELRREKLTRAFRRWGWIGGVLILVIVAGSGWQQWSQARDEARAELFGDALLEALDTGSPEARREALAAIPATGSQAVIRDMIEASDPQEDKPATLAALDKVIADQTLDPAWRDLAILRRVIVAGADQPVAERRAALEGIAVPGRPYRLLAAEQLAWLLIEEGNATAAIAALNSLSTDQEASAALRGRAGQIVTVLGGNPAEVVSDVAPSDAAAASGAAPAGNE